MKTIVVLASVAILAIGFNPFAADPDPAQPTRAFDAGSICRHLRRGNLSLRLAKYVNSR